MIFMCPNCHAELEGDATPGEMIECPDCHKSFRAAGANPPVTGKAGKSAPIWLSAILCAVLTLVLASSVESRRGIEAAFFNALVIGVPLIFSFASTVFCCVSLGASDCGNSGTAELFASIARRINRLLEVALLIMVSFSVVGIFVSMAAHVASDA